VGLGAHRHRLRPGDCCAVPGLQDPQVLIRHSKLGEASLNKVASLVCYRAEIVQATRTGTLFRSANNFA
jgi:hypothetical protein